VSHQVPSGPEIRAASAPGTGPGRVPPVSRRAFLAGLSAGSGAVAVAVYTGFSLLDQPAAGPDGTPGPTPGATPGVAPAVVTTYPRVRVASLKDLKVGDVIDFQYPTELSPASLVRLDRTAAGGVGPDEDVVAFATDCTHMGCPLRGLYKKEHAILGPCACHYTTFDLAHRGMVVIGQATESLPQIILDLEGDDIIAVGTLGIVYGFRDNLADAPVVEGL